MIAEVPPLMIDLLWWLGFLGVLLGATWLTPLRNALKWVFRRLVSEPIMGAFRNVIRDENKPTEDAVKALTQRFDEHESYVRHHLGANGTTSPLVRRVAAIEEAITSP